MPPTSAQTELAALAAALLVLYVARWRHRPGSAVAVPQAPAELEQAAPPHSPAPKAQGNTAAWRGARAGVRVGWLTQFAARCIGMTTWDVVQQIIKPETAAAQCRYVALLSAEDVGSAVAFCSHTWRAPFQDLAAAVAHVLSSDAFVWLDVFAVLQNDAAGQEAEKEADLDFRAVVAACEHFILFSMHLPELVQAGSGPRSREWQEAQGDESRWASALIPRVSDRCAFFRVWCLVELGEALQRGKPVIMLVGAADASTGEFKPERSMLKILYDIVDVRHAAATFEVDRTRIIGEIEQGVGIERLNILARGAIIGAEHSMTQRELLAAVMGNEAPLAEVREREKLNLALRAAAAGGFLRPLRLLLARQDELDVDTTIGSSRRYTPLMEAAAGGHAAAIEMLVAADADVHARVYMSFSRRDPTLKRPTRAVELARHFVTDSAVLQRIEHALSQG